MSRIGVALIFIGAEPANPSLFTGMSLPRITYEAQTDQKRGSSERIQKYRGIGRKTQRGDSEARPKPSPSPKGRGDIRTSSTATGGRGKKSSPLERVKRNSVNAPDRTVLEIHSPVS